MLKYTVAIVASPLSELRTVLGRSSTDEEVTFACQVKLDLGVNVPLFICLSTEENTLVVASSSVITTWDVQGILNGEVSGNPQRTVSCQANTLQVAPSNSLTLSELVIVDVQPNPGDNPELVAVLTTGNSQDAPCVVLLYNCVMQTEMVRWSGTMREGTAPVASEWPVKA